MTKINEQRKARGVIKRRLSKRHKGDWTVAECKEALAELKDKDSTIKSQNAEIQLLVEEHLKKDRQIEELKTQSNHNYELLSELRLKYQHLQTEHNRAKSQLSKE